MSRRPITLDNPEMVAKAGMVNHPRGVRIENGNLIVSSLHDWFQVDFGGSEQGVIEHLRRFAESSPNLISTDLPQGRYPTLQRGARGI